MGPDKTRLFKEINKTAKRLSFLLDQLEFEENEQVRRQKTEREYIRDGDIGPLHGSNTEKDVWTGNLVLESDSNLVLSSEREDGSLVTGGSELSTDGPEGVHERETRHPDGNKNE